MNLFDGFTAGELEKLSYVIHKILEDLTTAFQNALDLFKLKSRVTTDKTCSPDTTTSSHLKHKLHRSVSKNGQ